MKGVRRLVGDGGSEYGMIPGFRLCLIFGPYQAVDNDAILFM